MGRFEDLKADIGKLFESGKTFCLWFSGGSDSRLLLETMLSFKQPFGILTFGDGWTREQRKEVDAVIIEKNLQVFSYPGTHTLIAENDEIGLISAYAVDGYGNSALLGRDLVDGPTCSFDVDLETPKQSPALVEFDIHVQGLKRSDRHWARGDEPLTAEKEWSVGTKHFVAPLFDWTDKQVRSTLKKEFGVDLTDRVKLGDIEACTRCLTADRVLCPKSGTEIDGVKWDAKGNLELVRSLLDAA